MVRKSLVGATESTCDVLRFFQELRDKQVAASCMLGFVIGLIVGYHIGFTL